MKKRSIINYLRDCVCKKVTDLTIDKLIIGVILFPFLVLGNVLIICFYDLPKSLFKLFDK